jgi:hypothetical protein
MELDLGAPDAQDTGRRLRAVGDELSDRFHGRADVVRTLVVTLPSVLGPPSAASPTPRPPRYSAPQLSLACHTLSSPASTHPSSV